MAPLKTMDVFRVKRLSSHLRGPCTECVSRGLDGHFPQDDSYLEHALNHELKVHGRRLIHVGPETVRAVDGLLLHTTIALLAE